MESGPSEAANIVVMLGFVGAIISSGVSMLGTIYLVFQSVGIRSDINNLKGKK